MRIAVFGDIHGDFGSMQRVVEAIKAERPDQVVCMGDVVVHGHEPNECVELLRAHPSYLCVKGNHDHGASVPDHELEGLHFFSRAGLRHTQETRRRLSRENRAYLANLPDAVRVADATFTHATMRSRYELLNNTESVSRLFGDMETPILFSGHTHRTWIHRRLPERITSVRPLLTGRDLILDPAVPVIVNLGNTAQLLYDRLPPVWVLYDTVARKIEFRELGE